jgi:enoyl-CoA hydratase/carnithine racemase
MAKVLYESDGRIARITLNRADVLNAIDDELPVELAEAVAKADGDDAIHIIVLSGAGRAFCVGYDLAYYAQGAGTNKGVQDMPWDPMKDYTFMMRNTELFRDLALS